MNGRQFWELYQSYGDVYLNEEVQINEKNNSEPKKNRPNRFVTGKNDGAGNKSRRRRGLEPIRKQSYDDRQELEKFGSEDRHQESVDYTDLVMNHLLDEGYVDSVEDAIVLMANMSEEWIETIVEEAEEINEARMDDNLSPYQKALARNRRNSSIQHYLSHRPGLQTGARREQNRETRGVNKRKAGLTSGEMGEPINILNYSQRTGETNKPLVTPGGEYLHYYNRKKRENITGKPVLHARRERKRQTRFGGSKGIPG